MSTRREEQAVAAHRSDVARIPHVRSYAAAPALPTDGQRCEGVGRQKAGAQCRPRGYRHGWLGRDKQTSVIHCLARHLAGRGALAVKRGCVCQLPVHLLSSVYRDFERPKVSSSGGGGGGGDGTSSIIALAFANPTSTTVASRHPSIMNGVHAGGHFRHRPRSSTTTTNYSFAQVSAPFLYHFSSPPGRENGQHLPSLGPTWTSFGENRKNTMISLGPNMYIAPYDYDVWKCSMEPSHETLFMHAEAAATVAELSCAAPPLPHAPHLALRPIIACEAHDTYIVGRRAIYSSILLARTRSR
ncbi:hypothetical protein M433DRAFT_8806 [Acidomyces richmondensis BFW]|nr:hypothetical protein M433DRAFT_8806 [Acidomyces richmondensis BFW]